MQLSDKIEAKYKSSLQVSVILQICLIVFDVMAVDLILAQWIMLAVVCYWMMALLVILRRPRYPTWVDLVAIRYGFPVILIALAVATVASSV